ncbi:hypothetical protein JQ604_14940 [Bradyrhizobium jicamae]|uniref:hypothetical protein n=1 Tax=Bradyrhizobium jicamae TaxID=280332 RepID=UPI001BAD0560|nr:hypothetical protein [Bradyrhizobium jicamae]MBR0753482.1 hypothetical protein [Bradyrhizobium jicamae]
MLLLAVILIGLHSIDGRQIDINPKQITTLREARGDEASGKYLTKGVRCMVSLADAKYVTVIETCSVVREKIEAAR